MTAVPTAPTFVDGLTSASQWNQVRDSINFALNPPIAKLRQATAQSIPNNTFTTLTFDAEDLDSVDGHDLVTNNSRYTAVYPGWHMISGGCTFAANATGRRLVRPQVNGTAVSGSLAGMPGNASIIGLTTRTMPVYLNVGDYVEMGVYQDSGAALNTFVTNTEYQPSMAVQWVSI